MAGEDDHPVDGLGDGGLSQPADQGDSSAHSDSDFLVWAWILGLLP